MIRKFVITTFVFIAAFIATTAIISKTRSQEQISQGLLVSVDATPQPEIINSSKPARISIPAIGVNAAIEHVGLAPDGRMDVPKAYENVGWWQMGARPGIQGSAVLAGHFDTPTGEPGVFYDLKQLKKGDIIEVEDEEDLAQLFEVVETKLYPDANFPIDLVFGRTDEKWLNLITCDGVFDQETNNYTDRYVVFSRLKEK